jgi:phosphatidyl-myo-inositol dimannoside synthase
LNKDDKIKLLFASRSYPPIVGGMEIFSLGLYNGLKDKAEVDQLVNTQNRIFLPLYAIRLFLHTLFFSQKYDVVYCNDTLTCFFALPAKILHRKPLVTSTYGLDVGFNKIKQKNLFMEFLRHVYKLIFSFTLKQIDYFLPISKGTKELGDEIGLKKQEIIVPGMELKNYDVNLAKKQSVNQELHTKYQIPVSKKILYSVGRLVKRKGHFWFVKNVMPKIQERYHYLLAGTGEQYEEIKNYVENSDLKTSVSVLGRPTDEDRNAMYLGADVFLMPNIKVEGDWEGFGIVAVESSLFGTPVLAADLEGVTSAVTEGKNGVLFKSEDSSDAIKKLQKLQTLNLSPKQVSKFTRDTYNNGVMAEKYIEVFKKLV